MIGKVSIAVGDYLTLANVAVAMPEFQAFPVKAASGTTLYAFIRTTGTPTYTANCLQLTFGFLRD